MTQELRIGMLGCGVVGRGLLELLTVHRNAIAQRLGFVPRVTQVAVRNPSTPRPEITASGAQLQADPQAVVQASDVDLVVEVMGGLDPAEALIRSALEAGKPVVTANKALIAERGAALLALAETKQLDLYFEAAVAGGIPIIRVLRESLAADAITELRGIVNGTTNYILSRMAREGLAFDEVLAAAQAAGYAEADPTLDIGGGDAQHKLAILATLAFGQHVDPAAIPTQGIVAITPHDHAIAGDFGYTLKHLAQAKRLEDGRLSLCVGPMLVPSDAELASIQGATNAIELESFALGKSLLSGPGAGGLPTAMSVLSDVIDVGRNLGRDTQNRVPPRAQAHHTLEDAVLVPADDARARMYLHCTVHDQPGVLGFLATRLGQEGVSIERMVQRRGPADPEHVAAVVMLTHETTVGAVTRAVSDLRAHTDRVLSVKTLRIEAC